MNDELDKSSKECRFYLKRAFCASPDAPTPRYSRCIGTVKCGAWEKRTISDQDKFALQPGITRKTIPPDPFHRSTKDA